MKLNVLLGTGLARRAKDAALNGWTTPFLFAILAVLVTLVVRRDGPVVGEVGLTLWMHRNSPAPIDFLGEVLDPMVTDVTAPILFAAICLLVGWRWGRHAATVLGLAGAFTALTRIGDIVERPRPTSSGTWADYAFGNGGYPSGHVVFTVLILGTLALLARRHSTDSVARYLKLFGVVVLIVTSWTRISLLKHWPLDVIGAFLMASFTFCLVLRIERSIDVATIGRPGLRRLLGLPVA